jgi:hypothetical protein
MLKPMLAFMDLEAKIIVAQEIQDLEETIGRTQIIFNVNDAKAEIEVTYGEGSKYDIDTQ